MTGLVMTRTAIWDESLSAARNGILPALIGALGAAIALNMLALINSALFWVAFGIIGSAVIAV